MDIMDIGCPTEITKIVAFLPLFTGAFFASPRLLGEAGFRV
jgi:hypothetical protein